MAGFTLDQSAIRRIGAETRKSELRPTDLRGRPADKRHPPGAVGRFKLLTPLDVGRFAVGRMMQLERADEPGEFEWIDTGLEEPVFAGGSGWNNHWPEGAEVTCVATAAGWMVTTDELAGALPGGFEPFPYAIYVLSHVSTSHQDTIQLGLAGDSGIAPWRGNYAVGTKHVPANLREDVLPGDTRAPRLRIVPVSPLLGQPLKAAYLPWDGTLNGEPLPDSIIEALQESGGAHPAFNDFWGPGRHGKLTRTVRFIEIFWWELCSPEPVCETVTVPNPDYDPDDPDSPPTIEEDQWIIPACSGTPVPGTRTGISCDEDPPPRRSAFFRSINGWWGLPGWNWGWWHGIGWWTPGFGPGHVAWSDAYWWGPFGANWWGWHWLGGPPTDDDLLELPGDEPPPTPPCGGIIRRHRYGFIMWEYGWRILGTDRDNEVATIAGPFEFRTRLVVENPDPPDPSCDDDSGY